MLLLTTYSPAKDAENYVRTLFDLAYKHHGDVKRNQAILEGITIDGIRGILADATNRETALECITELLEGHSERSNLEQKAASLQNEWLTRGKQIIFQLEALYGLPCPFDQIDIDLTTIPSCPYDYAKKRIFVHAEPGIQTQFRILSHELNHFFFYFKYAKSLSSRLEKRQLETLKESLTVFTNPEQRPYPEAAPLVEKYIAKGIKTIEDAIEAGVEFFSKTSLIG